MTSRNFLSGILPFLVMMLGMGLVGCQGGDDTASIKEKEAAYRAATSGAQNMDPAEKQAIQRDLAEAYMAYSAEHPTDPQAPEYLYRAGEMFETNLADFQKAIDVFDQITTKYPDTKRAPDALFRKAYIYHNYFQNFEEAKALFSSFIETYPDDELVPSAEFEIKYMGVPNDELLDKIRKDSSVQEESDEFSGS
ncbi:tetratricopeptide repeat protein [Pontibacter sp. G13]|uniref:tetratricopeptide repeat protein n=1 Tax=Pontibacter sp. G13 TaxID=3074898 RepID=UPI00288C4ACE|nr:tetratricopeptide repeat protein [Pontibacter sp. G13]WNJ16031.1 tetratricopeptide repeat protein [Pontibacter sp. G13]